MRDESWSPPPLAATVLCSALFAWSGCGDDLDSPPGGDAGSGVRDGARVSDGAADGGGSDGADATSSSGGRLGSACDDAQRDCKALAGWLPGIATLICYRETGAKRGFCTFYCDIPPDPYPLRYGLVTLCASHKAECLKHTGNPRSVCTPPARR